MDSTYHVSATDLGHDNKQNNFFPCFPFSSFMLLWLLLKLLLDRQLWRKGGIAATCRWCCCLLFLLGFFSAGKKAEKLQHAWVWGQSTNGPLSLLKHHFLGRRFYLFLVDATTRAPPPWRLQPMPPPPPPLVGAAAIARLAQSSRSNLSDRYFQIFLVLQPH